MFKFVESIYDQPMKLFPLPGVRFEPGCIAEIKYINDFPFADLSVGNKPLGIVGNSIYVEAVSYNPKDRVFVWSQRMVFRTDNMEPGDYETGDGLYCSRNGLLTAEAPSGEPAPIARVISVFQEKNMLECLFL